MRRRPLIFCLILFQALWFNIIVPGHQRGIVQLSSLSNAPRCCCGGTDGGKPLTPAQRAQNCAICFFCAHVAMPPVFTFDHAPLGLLRCIQPQKREDLFSRIVLVPFDSCGPPALC